MIEVKVFLTNLGKYVEGKLIGEWVTLPVTDEELTEVLARIGINSEYEEHFISDYEVPFDNLNISEYASIEELNDFADQLDELNSWDEDKLSAILEYESVSSITDIMDIIEHLDDFELFTEVNDDRELGWYFAEMLGVIDEIPARLQNYFDFRAYGRDIRLESAGGFTSYGFVMDNR